VRDDGYVRHEYLDRWQPHSSLSELITLLASAFGAYPPLATVRPKGGVSSLVSSASSLATSAYQRVADSLKSSGGSQQPHASPNAAPPAYGYGAKPPSYGAAASPAPSASSGGGAAPGMSAGGLWPGTELTAEQRRRCLEDMVLVKLDAAHKAAHRDRADRAAELHRERVAAASALSQAEAAHAELHRAEAEGAAALEQVQAERTLLSRWIDVHGATAPCVAAVDPRSEHVAALVAEDRAVEAALECLRDLLRQRRVGVDAYMAQVRALGMRQYEARALAMQIAK
jgi:hypothetical protein